MWGIDCVILGRMKIRQASKQIKYALIPSSKFSQNVAVVFIERMLPIYLFV